MRKVKNEITDDSIVLKILELLQKQGKTGKNLELALGLIHGTVYKWKYHGIKSYKKHLNEIDEFLGRNAEELKDGHDSIKYFEKLEPDEKHIIEVYRMLKSAVRGFLMQTIEYLESEAS